jgi:tetratricopeptide (TPR) repeat protein
MSSSSARQTPPPIRSHRSWRLTRAFGAIAFVAGSSLALSACGGPSASAQASTNLAAGIAAQNAGNLVLAASYYNKVLATQPRNPYALFDLGTVEQAQANNAAAESDYRAALAILPGFSGAMFNLATLVAKSNPTEAEALYRQVLRQSPHDANAHLNLGFVLLSLHKTTEGNAQLHIAVTLSPGLKSRIPKS